MRVHIDALRIRDVKYADQVDRVVLERIGARIEPAVFDVEVFVARARLQESRQESRQRRTAFLVLLFERRAENARKIAHILRDQKIGAHESLDRAERAVVHKTHDARHFGLNVEGKTFFRAADDIVKMAADVPQKRFSLLENLVFLAREYVSIDEIRRIVDVIEILADPVERLQIAQAALAVLDVGLDEIPAFALSHVPLAALQELGFDEVLLGPGRHFGPKSFAQLVVKLFVAPQEAGFEQRGADGQILLGKAHAFGERARRMADLESQIPQHVQNEFDDAFAPGGLLERPHEEKGDIGAGRELSAAIAAGRHDCDAFGLGGILRVVKMLGREVVENLNKVVLNIRQRARGDNARHRTAYDTSLDERPRIQKGGLDVR